MANATIKQVWTDSVNAYISATVQESASELAEYTAFVPNDAAFQALSAAQKKTALTAALKAERDKSRAAPPIIGGISGSVTI